MTGLYPPGWKGRTFDRATKGWVAGETSLVVRDVQQKKLCGEPGVDELFGTGMIPKDLFVDKPSLARGVTDAYDTIQVRHVSGGVSVARFKSYEQGRQKFQGESIDWGWCDEEPPEDVYAEFLTRTVATGGMCFMTFTPLKGARAWCAVSGRALAGSWRGVDDDRGRAAYPCGGAGADHCVLPHERGRARAACRRWDGSDIDGAGGGVTEAPLEYVPRTGSSCGDRFRH
jgi:phage terminase large subunit-like protein